MRHFNRAMTCKERSARANHESDSDSMGDEIKRVSRRENRAADVTPEGKMTGLQWQVLYPGSQSEQITADPRMVSGLDETLLTEEQWGLIQPERAHSMLELGKDASPE